MRRKCKLSVLMHEDLIEAIWSRCVLKLVKYNFGYQQKINHLPFYIVFINKA